MRYEAVLFDWDGVVTNSAGIKTEAYARMFAPLGQSVLEKVLAAEKNGGGISRVEKLRRYYGDFAGQQLSEEELAAKVEIFTQIVRQKIYEAPLIPEVLQTLENLQQMQVPAFVVSGAPREEVADVAEKRGLSCFFREICGSPPKKNVLIAKILERYGYQPERVLLFGDGLADWEAAKENGIDFTGIIGKENIFPPEVRVCQSVRLPD